MFATDTFDAGRVAALRKQLAGLGSALDPALLSEQEAETVVAEAQLIENIAVTIKTLAAGRAAEGGGWRRRGARSAADDLARRTSTNYATAKGVLATAAHLHNQPKLSAAARQGKLSAPQAAAISDAAAADPAAEERLLNKAGRVSLRELRDDCANTKAAADPNPDATHRRIHADRSCRQRSTPDGGGEIVYHSTTDEVAEVWPVISAFATAAFNAARKEGRREPATAYAADGLLNMARAAAATGTGGRARKARPGGTGTGDTGGGANPTPASPTPANPTPTNPTPTNPGPANPDPADGADHGTPKPIRPDRIIVRIDWDALIRGWPIDGEVSEIAGIGPVPVSVVRAMAASGDAFLAAVVTKGRDVATVAHLGRQPTTFQDTALLWRDPYCTNSECGAVVGLERDHQQDWARTKITLLRYLDHLCRHDHKLKTRYNWALVPGTGRRPLVPPDDPRHPNNTQPKRDPAGPSGPPDSERPARGAA